MPTDLAASIAAATSFLRDPLTTIVLERLAANPPRPRRRRRLIGRATTSLLDQPGPLISSSSRTTDIDDLQLSPTLSQTILQCQLAGEPYVIDLAKCRTPWWIAEDPELDSVDSFRFEDCPKGRPTIFAGCSFDSELALVIALGKMVMPEWLFITVMSEAAMRKKVRAPVFVPKGILRNWPVGGTAGDMSQAMVLVPKTVGFQDLQGLTAAERRMRVLVEEKKLARRKEERKEEMRAKTIVLGWVGDTESNEKNETVVDGVPAAVVEEQVVATDDEAAGVSAANTDFPDIPPASPILTDEPSTPTKTTPARPADDGNTNTAPATSKVESSHSPPATKRKRTLFSDDEASMMMMNWSDASAAGPKKRKRKVSEEDRQMLVAALRMGGFNAPGGPKRKRDADDDEEETPLPEVKRMRGGVTPGW